MHTYVNRVVQFNVNLTLMLCHHRHTVVSLLVRESRGREQVRKPKFVYIWDYTSVYVIGYEYDAFGNRLIVIDTLSGDGKGGVIKEMKCAFRTRFRVVVVVLFGTF